MLDGFDQNSSSRVAFTRLFELHQRSSSSASHRSTLNPPPQFPLNSLRMRMLVNPHKKPESSSQSVRDPGSGLYRILCFTGKDEIGKSFLAKDLGSEVM